MLIPPKLAAWNCVDRIGQPQHMAARHQYSARVSLLPISFLRTMCPLGFASSLWLAFSADSSMPASKKPSKRKQESAFVHASKPKRESMRSDKKGRRCVCKGKDREAAHQGKQTLRERGKTYSLRVHLRPPQSLPLPAASQCLFRASSRP